MNSSARAVKQQKRGGLWWAKRNESCARLEWLALHQLQTHLWSFLPVPDHAVTKLGFLAISELIQTNLLVLKNVLLRSSLLMINKQHDTEKLEIKRTKDMGNTFFLVNFSVIITASLFLYSVEC